MEYLVKFQNKGKQWFAYGYYKNLTSGEMLTSIEELEGDL